MTTESESYCSVLQELVDLSLGLTVTVIQIFIFKSCHIADLHWCLYVLKICSSSLEENTLELPR